MIKEVSSEKTASGRQYWKSLDDLSQTSGFKEWIQDEFPQGASLLDGFERRGFMKIMAASFGLAGLGMTGCRRPEHTILPYGKSPEELIPGVPNYYATSMPSAHGNLPLIVESHSGRPTKIEGNPSFLPYGGSTDVYAQASILDLYDPDRARGSFRKDSKTGSWNSVSTDSLVGEVSEWSKDGRVAILTDRSFSEARSAVTDELIDKGVKCFEFEAVDLLQSEKHLAAGLGLEGGLRTIPDLAKAHRVISLDCDFLGSREPYALANTRSFMGGRKVSKPSDTKKMNRLYSVEADMTLTGGVADHRLRLESSQFTAFSCLLAAEVLTLTKSSDKSLIEKLKGLGSVANNHLDWVKACAEDLCKKPDLSVVLPGNHLPQEVHVTSFLINQALGSIGKTIRYLPTKTSNSSIGELAKAIEAGDIDHLLIVGGNPVFLSKSFIDWDSMRSKLKSVGRLGYTLDETSEFSDFHIGQSHYLEAWDLSATWDGRAIVPVQPLLSPLFDTSSDLELFMKLNDSEMSSYELVKKLHSEKSSAKSFEDFLRLGVHETKPKFLAKPESGKISSYVEKITLPDSKPSADNLDLLLIPDFHAWDGRFVNNGWMQECPNPMTKLTWDNAILISPKLAKKLESDFPDIGLLPKATMLNKTGEIAPDNADFSGGKQKAPVVKISFGKDDFIEGPIYVQPGLADFAVVATLGMGREITGRVGEGTGFDASSILDGSGSRLVSGGSISKPQDKWEYKILANVQEHWSMEGRAIIREANAADYVEDEHFAAHMGAESHSPPMWGKDQDKDLAFKSKTTPRGNSAYEHPDHTSNNSTTYGRHQWGMAIDLSQCTGCSACVVACQSENNIPIVGKDQVLRGREMHWIRLDRYYSSAEREGDEIPSDVQVSFQSISCMHCETAPCESVCPVNATVHDEEGLNAMAYNRCVGTRYCANNCPYKVRRFNFFDWNKRNTNELYKGPLGEKNDSISSMGKNPDVTVRMRGVMEKCTYCVQRIQESKIQVKVKAQRQAKLASGKDGNEIELSDDQLKVPDGTIVPACQQVCPSDGVAFGDLSDPDSRVSQLKNDPRNYSVLGYLNTRPRTTYLAKIRNPNTQMPDFSGEPHSSREYHDKAHPVHHDEDGHGDDHNKEAGH
jgi:molybdopterin-containing oxidoreductase family iron-sulfur binding subunit